MTMRLDKFLVATGQATRSQARALVKAKRLSVNGQIAKKVDLKLDEHQDIVTLDGKTVIYREFDYIMLNKPAGVISATEDRYTKTVLNLLPPCYQRVAPVGRLDKDTVGLLLLTNDGQLNHQLLSPKKHVDKTYLAILEKSGRKEDITTVKAGLVLDDGYQCLPAHLRYDHTNPHKAYLTIQEGKFHQVKRMFQALDNRVLQLKRLSMGCLKLDENLAEGEWRLLTDEEVTQLKVYQSS